MVTKHNIPYIETRAKDPPLNVDEAFHDLIKVIRQQIQKKKPDEEEENQTLGRLGHGHPQTAVRDIVMAQGPGHSDWELASPRDSNA